MKQKSLQIILTIGFLITATVIALSQDTTKTKGLFFKPIKKESPFSYELGLATTNLWRGVDVGRQTCAKAEAEYEPVKWFTARVSTTIVSNQYKIGYGNQLNSGVDFNLYNVSFGLQDVYFQDNTETSNDTDYFNVNKATTNHFVEATFKYKGDSESKIDLKANYVFYQNAALPRSAWYVETIYHIASNTQIFAGYITGPSYVNFQNKSGFTNVGVHIKRTLEFSKNFNTIAKFTLSVNPNYKTVIVPNSTVANRPVNAVITIIF